MRGKVLKAKLLRNSYDAASYLNIKAPAYASVINRLFAISCAAILGEYF